jgi:hypothetical protein
MTFWKEKNCGDKKRSEVAKGFWEGEERGMNSQKRIFKPLKELCLIL